MNCEHSDTKTQTQSALHRVPGCQDLTCQRNTTPSLVQEYLYYYYHHHHRQCDTVPSLNVPACCVSVTLVGCTGTPPQLRPFLQFHAN